MKHKKPSVIQRIGQGLQVVGGKMAGRKPDIETEAMYAVSQILNEAFRRFSQDSGLITATGKTHLEETQGLEIFEEMSRDSQIKASLMVKKFTMLASKWEVYPYHNSNKVTSKEQDKKAVEIADFVKFNLRRLLGDRAMGFEPVMSAFAYGRSVNEIIFEPIQLGEYANKYRIAKLKPKNIGFVEWEMDKFNNITTYISRDAFGEERNVNPFKVLHYAWDSEFDNPFGKPDLASCYPWFWGKKALFKFFMIFADKFAVPIPVIELEKSLSPADADRLDDAAKNYHMSNFFRLPRGVKLELHQSSGTGGPVYIQGIRECDSQMSRAILAQTLATNENLKTGTNAQAEVHQETMGIVLSKVQNDLEMNIAATLIKRLVDINYGPQEGYPEFRFLTIDKDTMDKLATIINTLCNVKDEFGNQLVHPREDWIRDYLGIPYRDTDEFPWRDELSPEMQATLDLKREQMNNKEKPPGNKPPEKKGSSSGK